jgi:signal transduction histidine kinase
VSSSAVAVSAVVTTADAIGVLLGWWPLTVRLVVFTCILGTAVLARRGILRVEVLLAVAAALVAALSLADGLIGGRAGALDPGSTLGLMVVIGVIHAAIRAGRDHRPLVAYVATTAVFAVTSIVLDPGSLVENLGRLLVGIPAHAIAVITVRDLIARASRAQAQAERNEATERALAACSEELLIRSGDDAVCTAVTALLAASDAAYVYVDVNSVAADGTRRWEIVADAESGDQFGGPDEFASGGYDEMAWVEAQLESGSPVTIDVASLPASSTRTAYEREGVGSELIAPIHIDGRWVGSIGFSHPAARNWDHHSVALAVRAAHMIGAYWARQRAREGLVALNDARSRFVASVSHELRTPMTAVLGFAAELADHVAEMTPAEIADIAEIIRLQSEEVKALIDDLLVLERANVGDLTIKPVEVKVAGHLEELASAMGKPVEVGAGDAVVWADPLRLRQILRNLLTNAVKHGGNSIRAELIERSDEVEVVISDNGRGIGPLAGDRVFDEFVRAGGDATKPDSVGLGLAVARKLARMGGGELTHRRRAERTEFILSLPKPPGPG